MMPKTALGQYGRLYQVRRPGARSYPCGEGHLDANGRDTFAEIHLLIEDPSYDGGSPRYWMVGDSIYSGDWAREKLEKEKDGPVRALRFREDVEQASLGSFVEAGS